jgi:hypothetical protein
LLQHGFSKLQSETATTIPTAAEISASTRIAKPTERTLRGGRPVHRAESDGIDAHSPVSSLRGSFKWIGTSVAGSIRKHDHFSSKKIFPRKKAGSW